MTVWHGWRWLGVLKRVQDAGWRWGRQQGAKSLESGVQSPGSRVSRNDSGLRTPDSGLLTDALLAALRPTKRKGPILKGQAAERLFPLAALRQAWLAIKQAKGGPGVDGVTLEEFGSALDKELGTLQMELVSGIYQPQPVRQVLVPKASGGLRPLAIWALRDRVAQRAVYDLIAPVFEEGFLPCSFGFRPGRGVSEAVSALETLRDQNLRWVVDADIKDCFDTLDAGRLLQLVGRRVRDRLLCHYIAGWLYADIFNSADGVPKKAGASQGSVLSPLLANIYLHEVDQVLAAQKLAYLRYADDFVICCRTKAEAGQALEQSQQALARWGLHVNATKTQIRHFDQGFSWLGYFFVRRECYQL